VYNAWYDKQIGAQQRLVLVVWAPETASQSARAEALHSPPQVDEIRHPKV
jgi:hypothetical protein